MIDLFLNKISAVDSNKTALIYNNNSTSYGQLLNRIDELYEIISSSFDEKKAVVISGDYSLDSIALIFALCKHKCIFIPIVSTNKKEIEKKIEVSDPDIIIDANSLSIDVLRKNNDTTNDYFKDLYAKNSSGLVLFSSGSSGTPKAMVHDFDNLLGTYLEGKFKNLTFLVFLLFDHIGGLNTILNVLSMGSTLVIPVERTPEGVALLIQKFNVNILPASPTFLNLMNIGGIFENYDLSSLKLITYGTEPMAESLLRNLNLKLPKTRLIQTFGTSETGIIKTKSKSSTSLLVKFDDPNQEVKIVEGELWIKSKTRVLGYINHDDSFSNDEWFKTGDLIEEKDNGYYKIIGRKSKVINVGGEKVLPIEVETIILKLPYIIDCTVYSKDNPITGQVVAVRVVVSNNDLEIKQLKKDIKKHCKQNLDRFKVPAEIIINDKIIYSSRFKKSLD